MAETSSVSQYSTSSRDRWKFSPDQKIVEVLAPTVRNHGGFLKRRAYLGYWTKTFSVFLKDAANIRKPGVVRDGKYDPVLSFRIF